MYSSYSGPLSYVCPACYMRRIEQFERCLSSPLVQDTFIPWQSSCGPYITPSRQFSTKRHHPLLPTIFGSIRVLFDRKEFENAEGRPKIVPLEGSSAGCWALFCIKTAFIVSCWISVLYERWKIHQLSNRLLKMSL